MIYLITNPLNPKSSGWHTFYGIREKNEEPMIVTALIVLLAGVAIYFFYRLMCGLVDLLFNSKKKRK